MTRAVITAASLYPQNEHRFQILLNVFAMIAMTLLINN